MLYPSGMEAGYAQPLEARQMLRGGVARACGKEAEIRCIMLFEGRSTAAGGTRYVHSHFVADEYLDKRRGVMRKRHPLDGNPEGVFTLKRLDPSTRHLFRISLYDATPGGRSLFQKIERREQDQARKREAVRR